MPMVMLLNSVEHEYEQTTPSVPGKRVKEAHSMLASVPLGQAKTAPAQQSRSSSNVVDWGHGKDLHKGAPYLLPDLEIHDWEGQHHK
eukprot:1137228-Pelagomonas_calceolata.AAC.2